MLLLNENFNNDLLTLKAIFKDDKLPKFINKTDGKVTLISEEKKLYLFFENKEKLTFQKIYQAILEFVSCNKFDINIDSLSFKTDKIDEDIVIQCISEAILFKTHTEISYKQKSESVAKDIEYTIVTKNKGAENIIHMAKVKLISVNFARDLQDTPPNKMYPEIFVKEVEKRFEPYKNDKNFIAPKITILDKKAIEKLEMGLLLSVANGSHNEPRLLVIEYKNNPNSKEVLGLIGKGITFDTGGYSLKPPASQINMKFDMSGAAIVASTLLAITQLQLKTNVTAVLPLTENRIGGHATLVESVVKSLNGKTVEILNTDAEGRLVLADAITYAVRKEKVNKIIELSTLTGAMVMALGKEITGAFTFYDEFYDEFKKSTEKSFEEIWRMPITEANVLSMRDSKVADLTNLAADRNAGSSTAAAFLNEFNENIPYIHLDIAGTADKNSRGTGVMVKTLLEYIKN